MILIRNGIIEKITYTPSNDDLAIYSKENEDNIVIDCENKLVLPGIIDVHSHIRDLNQTRKETFETGTQAAASSGITTVFTMPNTDPPAIDSRTIEKWMSKAKDHIRVNVGFIAGVPLGINPEEMKKIIKQGVIGFKIYPHSPLNELDWTNPINFQILLNYSSIYQFPIFIHPSWPIPTDVQKNVYKKYVLKGESLLDFHDELNPSSAEVEYVKFVIKNYEDFIKKNNLKHQKYPIIHFCHVSSRETYTIIQNIYKTKEYWKLTFEVTPHHLLLSKEITLKNPNFAKVLPPLRDSSHSNYLFSELKNEKINIIATDHAPHTIQEKSQDFFSAPSGFPGFETYPLLLLNKVVNYELSLENFVRVSSENPAKVFGLKNKGFIKEGYDADLYIVDKISEYSIKSVLFKTKAKFSPFENFKTKIQIWKVFLKGKELLKDLETEHSKPLGKIIRKIV
ncbi:MAG: amidohydrolase family protein [Candidatus Lokiarchaeota archaeon]|nr:amidohydrolase family protein [Candidatus Lokiarchaeota archaeon]